MQDIIVIPKLIHYGSSHHCLPRFAGTDSCFKRSLQKHGETRTLRTLCICDVKGQGGGEFAISIMALIMIHHALQLQCQAADSSVSHSCNQVHTKKNCSGSGSEAERAWRRAQQQKHTLIRSSGVVKTFFAAGSYAFRHSTCGKHRKREISRFGGRWGVILLVFLRTIDCCGGGSRKTGWWGEHHSGIRNPDNH
jgi:hypothetical protein